MSYINAKKSIINKRGRIEDMSADSVMTVGGIAVVISLLVSVGICALMIWACKKIAEGKGLSSAYMWLGLLGVIGIIIVAVIPGKEQNNYGYTQYPQNQYGQPNMYGQPNQYSQPNQFGQQGQYSQSNQFGQYSQSNQQGYTLNGQSYTGTQNVTMCPKCGASTSGESDFCPFCGSKVN